MSENTPENGPESTPEQEGQAPDTGADLGAELTKWKALARKHEADAKAGKAAAARLAELEESQKTEQQKVLERLEAAERERDSLRTESLRLRIAADKGLTPKQAARLRGSTEEELLADADELLAEFGSSGPRRPVGDVDQGPRGSAPETTDPAKLADAVVARRGY